MTEATDRAGSPGPIFIIGSMRSGSTLLRLILDSHPNIAIGSETGFMGGLRHVKEIPSWKFGSGWYERLNWSEAEFDARLRDFYGGMFGRFALEQGKTRWGEKTPFHTSHIGEMARVFPDSVFVGIVRHPGAVAASLRKKFHYTFPDALAYWSAANLELARGGAALGDRFALCRYEDLVTEQEPVLREILALVDEPWDAAVLDHHRVQREKGAPRVVEGSTSTQEAVDPERAVQWLGSSSESDRQALQAVAPLATFFGYDIVDPVRSERPSARGRWLLDGDTLAARMAGHQDQVDFAARPQAVAIDANPADLAARLDRAEQALARARSRRAVRMVDAVRRVQRGRSLPDVRAAWTLARHPERLDRR